MLVEDVLHAVAVGHSVFSIALRLILPSPHILSGTLPNVIAVLSSCWYDVANKEAVKKAHSPQQLLWSIQRLGEVLRTSSKQSACRGLS